jgi:hypothetical protein
MFREFVHRVYQTLTRGRKRRDPRIKRTGRPTVTRLAIEDLEDRTLLSTITLTNGALVYLPSTGSLHDLTISDATHRYTFVDTAENITLVGSFISPSGNGTHAVSFGDGNISSIALNTGNQDFHVNVEQTLAIAPLTVNLGSGFDQVFVSPTARNLNSIQGAITIHGGLGTDYLTVNDQSNAAAQTFSIGAGSLSRSGAAAITYAGLSNLTVYAGNGNNVFNVSSMPFYAHLDTGDGQDTVNVNATGVGGGLLISEGAGAYTANVLATNCPVEIDGYGSNTVNVGDAGSVQAINGPLTIRGPASGATVNVDDSEDGAVRNVYLDTVAIDSSDYGRITGLAPAAVEYAYADTNSVTVQTGTGGATVNVLATDVPTSIVGHATGTVNIGNAGSVQQILGPLTITNPPSYTTVNVDDSADATARMVSLDTVTIGGFDYGRITGLAPAAIQYRYIDTTSATVETGPGGATVHAPATGKPVNLVGNPNAGTVSLVGSDANNTWNLTGQNAGTLNSSQSAGTVTFSNVQNLTGGAGTDTIVFADGAGVDGTIDGGGGTNTLDYSAYSSAVLVDLQTGSATEVGAGVANIQNVTGGSGGGAGVYNILVGNGGNILTGGDGRRNLLIAGASASTLLGGNDDDILVGGTTAYDTEAGLVSLQAIMDYWSNTTDDYATRVANLLSGNGVPLLDATMVTNNGGGNTMMGNHGGAGEMNLFYGMDPTLESTDFNPAIGEQFINI